MFIKIQHLEKEEDSSWKIGRMHLIECDEYVKIYEDDSNGCKKLVLRIIRGTKKEREMVFDNPTAHIDFFIMNSCGKTIESFTFQDKKIDK